MTGAPVTDFVTKTRVAKFSVTAAIPVTNLRDRTAVTKPLQIQELNI